MAHWSSGSGQPPFKRRVPVQFRHGLPREPAELGLPPIQGNPSQVHFSFSHHLGVAQLGRAPALGAGSRRFKSCHLDHRSVAYWHEALVWGTRLSKFDSCRSDCHPGVAKGYRARFGTERSGVRFTSPGPSAIRLKVGPMPD